VTTTSLPHLHVPKTFTALGVALTATFAAVLLDPPGLSLSRVGLILAAVYSACGASPVLALRRGHVETITLSGVPFTAALILLPRDEVLTALAIGAVAGQFVSRFAGPLPRIRKAPLERHLFNAGTDLLSVGIAVFTLGYVGDAHPYGLAIAAIGLELATQEVQHWFVELAISERSRSAVRRPQWRSATQRLGLALLGAVSGASLGLLLLAYRPLAPGFLLLIPAVMVLSRSLLARQTDTERLALLVGVARRAIESSTIGEIDDAAADVITDALGFSSASVVSDPPGGSGDWGIPIPGTSQWLAGHGRPSDLPLTETDYLVMEGIAAILGPTRLNVEMTQRLREAEAFKSLVLASAGHDLGNRMTMARGGLEVLRTHGDALPPEVREELLERCVAAILGAADILQELLQMTALDKQAPPDQGIDGDALRRFIAKLGLDHPVDVAADDAVRLTAHPVAVERVVENLLKNADRYHGGTEPLLVTLSRAEHGTRITVSDRGPGLPPDMVDSLFQPFTQVGTRRDRHGGVGLGLYLARGFTEAVGGVLRYESRPGGGSTFVVHYPDRDAITSANA
jgi:signal transduction histidine kinase